MSGSSANNTDNISRITAHYINDRSELSVDTIHIIVPIAGRRAEQQTTAAATRTTGGWLVLDGKIGWSIPRETKNKSSR
jgi:hypothetical protein